MSRGPKPQTAQNGPRRITRRIQHDKLEPTSALGPEATAEFFRLCDVLGNRGSLDRVDLGTVTECARIKVRLDKAYVDDDTKIIPLLSSQRRGLLRELGLTIKPSTTAVHAIAKSPETPSDPIADRIKIHA